MWRASQCGARRTEEGSDDPCPRTAAVPVSPALRPSLSAGSWSAGTVRPTPKPRCAWRRPSSVTGPWWRSRWARGSGWGWVWRSSRVTGTPWSASRRAAVQPTGPALTTMTPSRLPVCALVLGCWSFIVVVPSRRSGRFAAPSRQRAGGEREPGKGVVRPAGFGTGDGDDEPPVLLAGGDPRFRQPGVGQGVGGGAGGGVGGQGRLVVLADGRDRDRPDGVDPLRAGGRAAPMAVAAQASSSASSNRAGSAGTT